MKMKLKLKLACILQEVGDARIMGYLMKNVEKKELNQAKRKKRFAVNKAEESWRYEKGFQIRHSDEEFGICPADFCSCFGSLLSHFALFSKFWRDNLCPMPLYIGSM